MLERKWKRQSGMDNPETQDKQNKKHIKTEIDEQHRPYQKTVKTLTNAIYLLFIQNWKMILL